MMEYDMEEFMLQCLESYKELAHVKDVRPVPTPFVPEDQVCSPAGAPGVGTCVECLWCCHTFSPTVYESIDALEQAKLNAKKNSRETDSCSEGATLSDNRGKLAPVASRILMKVLWGARPARFDLLRAVCHLAQKVTNGPLLAIAHSTA